MTAAASTRRFPGPVLEAVLRTIAALPLAYLGAAATAAAASTLLAAAGVARSEAVGWPIFLSFVAWLVLALYAFAARSLWRAWAVPATLAIIGAVIVWRIDVGGML